MPAAVAKHGLNDVAYGRDEEPERRTEPCQHPCLREQKRKEGRNEAYEETEGVREAGVQIMHLFAARKFLSHGGTEAVGEYLVVTAESDDVAAGRVLAGGYAASAFVADKGILGEGYPFLLFVLSEVTQAGEAAQKGHERRHLFGAEP